MFVAHESDEDDGPSSLAPNQLTAEQIPTSISPAKNEDFIKQCIRTQVMTFKNPLRKLVWKQLYLRMEAVAGSTTDQFNAISLAEATAGFYQVYIVGKTDIKLLRSLSTSFFFSFLPGFMWNT